jgi:pyridoxal phosphate enzyme (YggS family)
VAVSKGVAAGRLRDALALGLTDLGENRVQEAESKVASLAGARWHMVGRLQSNKAARAVALFDEIHSVDSLALAERLDRLAGERGSSGRLPVYLQVNVDADAAKTGFAPPALEAAIGRLAALGALELRGLMTIGRIGPHDAEARATFRALRELSERLRAIEPQLGAGLSMGMSDDFELAVEEGATVVRIGRALFGARSG